MKDQPSTGNSSAHRDTLIGALDDGENGMFIIFMRSHESPLHSVSRIMLQSERGDVVEVSDCQRKGFLSAKFIITLTPKSGNPFNITPKKYLEVRKGGIAEGLAVASASAEFRKKVGDNYFPSSFWTPIPPHKLKEMIPHKWA